MYKKRESCLRSRLISKLFISKQGQVSVFILLGIILILAAALFILFQRQVITFEKKELVPVERGPVESFVIDCLELVSDEALFLMAQQGGFIQLPESVANDASRHLRTSPFTVVPYWAYGQIQDTPTLDHLKQRIDRHIEQNLPRCVLGAQAFQESYDLLEKSLPSSDTKIVDKKILYNVHWEIQVKNKAGEIVTELRTFIHESPIRLKAVHDLAVKVIERELLELKLEDLTQDLLALEPSNVPLFGLEFSCSEKRWRIDDVKQGIKDLLRVNLRELKVKGTEIIDFPKEQPYYQNHYLWDLEGEVVPAKVSTKFTFEDNYPFAFDVTPRSGQYLRSNELGSQNNLISALCIQSWKFVYNLDFPILIEVTDETTGYTLKFGTMVHLRNNLPDRSETTFTRRSTFFDTYSDDQFCRQATIPMTIKTYELVENQQIGVYVREPLDLVDVEYICLKYSCAMGQTRYDYAGLGHISAFKTNFPYCSGAIIKGHKDGYAENFISTVSRPEQELELNLMPLKQLPVNQVKVVKHTLDRNNRLSSAKELSKEEIALVIIKFKHNETAPPLHEFTLIKSPSLAEEITEPDKLLLLAKADFVYDLEINLLEEERIKGGYKGKWFVPWNGLQEAQQITFHVLSQEGLSETEQLELFASLTEKSLAVPVPEIK